MRNAFFSSVSPPQLYNFAGNNTEVQVPNLDICMQVDSIITNVPRSGFSMESRVFREENNRLRDGGFAVSCQSLFNYQQDFQSIITNCNNIPQHSLSLTRKRSFSQLDVYFESQQNTKIHVTEVNDLLPQKGISDDLACDKAASNLSKKIKKKNIKANSSCEEQSHHQVEETSAEIQNHRVPVRRSPKLSDKITALQKLVSPYGKTDTASVLQEASVYIKVLQGQIQNLFQMLTSSYESVTPRHSQEMGAEHLELKNRGLCLVPISFTDQVTKQGPVDPHQTSTKNQMNQNF